MLTSTVTAIGFEPRENTPAILGQNYPNPFSNQTIIPLNLPRSMKVSLQVFDQMGRPLATLVDGVMEQGKHQVKWETQNLPQGIYIYQVQGVGFMETKKMIMGSR